MRPLEIHTDDIDELFSWATDWDGTSWQIEAGPLGYRSQRRSFPGVDVLWQHFGRSILTQEVMCEPALVFSVVVGAQRLPRHRGCEVPAGACAVIRSGHELESVIPRGCVLLEIAVAPPVARSIGWESTPHGLMSVEGGVLAPLLAVCREVVFRAGTAAVEASSALADRDRILTRLAHVLESGLERSTSSRASRVESHGTYDIVRAARDVMDQSLAPGPLRVGDVADELGISVRALHAAFHRCLGIGPYEFHLLRRMHAVRQDLVSGPYVPGRVATAGRRVGLTDASSLSRIYRRCFGESPRETLRRRARRG